MTSSKEKLRSELAGESKPKQKKKVVHDVVCWKCGALGQVTASGKMPLNNDGSIRAICSCCKAFWRSRGRKGGTDLSGQRFLCFESTQKGE